MGDSPYDKKYIGKPQVVRGFGNIRIRTPTNKSTGAGSTTSVATAGCPCSACTKARRGFPTQPKNPGPNNIQTMARTELEILVMEQQKKIQELERVAVLYENLQKVGLLR